MKTDTGEVGDDCYSVRTTVLELAVYIPRLTKDSFITALLQYILIIFQNIYNSPKSRDKSMQSILGEKNATI